MNFDCSFLLFEYDNLFIVNYLRNGTSSSKVCVHICKQSGYALSSLSLMKKKEVERMGFKGK